MSQKLLFFIFIYLSIFANDYQLSLSLPLGQSKINLLDGKTDTIKIPVENRFLAGIHFKRSSFEQVEKLSIKLHSKKVLLIVDTVINENINSYNGYFSIDSLKNYLHYEGEIAGKQFRKKIVIEQIKLNNALQVSNVIFPVESDGYYKNETDKNKIHLSNRLIDKLQRLFQENTFNPVYGHFAIKVKNTLSQNITLVATLDLDNERDKIFFIPLKRENAHYKNISLSNLKLKAGTESVIRLPLYVNEQEIEEKEYHFKLKVTVLGSDHIIYSDMITVYCIKRSETETVFFISYLIISLIGLTFLMKLYKTEIKNFNLRIFTTVSLFSALNFVLTYIALFVDNTIFSLFGPFKLFFTSLLTELVSYLVIFTSILLYPRKGIIALLLLINYLLTSTFYSSFFLHQFLYFLFKIVVLESIFSIVRKYHINMSGFIFAFAFAVSDIVLKHYLILESSILFRIYYADWYIISYLLIVGFIYTFLAIWLANRMVKPIKNLVYYV